MRFPKTPSGDIEPEGFFYVRIKIMKLAFKILAALGVIIAGALALAGVFWFNFRNLDFGSFNIAGFGNSAGKQTDIWPAKDEPEVTQGETANPGNAATLLKEESAVAVKGGVPEKKVPAQEIISVPSAPELVKAVENIVSADYTLTRPGVIAETNRQRQANIGLGAALAENALLNLAAQSKVEDMFAGQYFEHVSPLGDNAAYFIGRAGYEYIAIGENLAMGNYEGDVALVQAWMDSPGHRENILKKGFTEIGVAVGYGDFDGRKVWLAVQEFGTPKSACPAVDEQLSVLVDGEKEELDNYIARQEKLSATIDMKKDVVESLQKELESMAASADSYSAINAKQRELDGAIVEANALVGDYNESVGEARVLLEEYKTDVENYNAQIRDYNDCVGAI